MRSDSRGIAITLDLLLALIPITIIIGMAGANMDNMLYTMESTVFQSSLERVGVDAANTLVQTSGVPFNWEQAGNPKIVGLAAWDKTKSMSEPNNLDPSKVVELNQQMVNNLIGPEYDFYLNITSLETNTTIKSLGVLNTTTPNVARIERLVITGNLQLVASLEGLIRDAGQPRTYSTTFPTNDLDVQTYDYWVLVENRGYDSATIDVNNNNVVPSNEFGQHILEIKKIINSTFLQDQTVYLDNIVNVRTVSNPGATMDVYVIAAPKGTPESYITLDNVKPMRCKFEFYIWIK